MGIIIQGLLIAILGSFTVAPVFADEGWIILETDKEEYSTGQSLVVTGLILERKMPVIAMSVYDPDGVILSANSVELQEDNSFSKTVSLDSPFYDKSGIYLIDFDYGKKTEQITFEIASTEQQEPLLPEIIPEVIFVETDEEAYHNNKVVSISGMVSIVDDPTILVGIYDPSGMPAGFYTPPIDSNLEFTASFLAKEGVNFKTFGQYTVKAHYGETKAETSFEFTKTPEPTANTAQPTRSSNSVEKPSSKKPVTDIVNTSEPRDSEPMTAVNVPSKPQKQEKPNIISESKQKENVEDEAELDNLSVEDVELGKMLNEIKLNCDSSQYMDSIIYYDGMGPALMRLCSYEQAISYFDQSIIEKPNNVEIMTNKGVAFGKLGQLDVAIEHYNMVLEIDPTYLPAMNNKANVLAERGEFEEAVKIYNSVLNQDPSYSIAKTNLQKVQEKIIKNMPEQETDIPHKDTIIPIMEKSIEKKEVELIQIRSPSIIEQIGSIFVGLFGILR